MTGICIACIAVALLDSGEAQAGTNLITEEEAKLPPPKGAVAADRRGILRGPRINFVSPAEPGRSPVHLQLRFESFGGLAEFCTTPFGGLGNIKVYVMMTESSALTAATGPPKDPFVQASSGASPVE